MSEVSNSDELREEYDFTPEMLRQGVRGKYAERYASGTNVVRLDPDVAEVFPDSEAVNRALRALVGIIKERSQASAA
ncbi:MAG: hypothetical protein M3418_12435 [Gemmatimonadota bacterium]|jgi:hypothetical protein|nr:hypothetical protein [Gemmatimonadota bacterium]